MIIINENKNIQQFPKITTITRPYTLHGPCCRSGLCSRNSRNDMISGHDSNSDSNLVTRIMCAKEQERKAEKNLKSML